MNWSKSLSPVRWKGKLIKLKWWLAVKDTSWEHRWEMIDCNLVTYLGCRYSAYFWAMSRTKIMLSYLE